jgi:hypothetical protein
MRLRDVPTGRYFRFLGETHVWKAMGSGWYANPPGYDGGPHHRGDNPEVEEWVIGIGHRVTYSPDYEPCVWTGSTVSPMRKGTVVDVLMHQTRPPVYRVRWDDGGGRVESADDDVIVPLGVQEQEIAV